jgi:uncharacterized protein
MKINMLVCILIFFCSGAHAVSFDCTKVTTLTEKVICTDAELLDLDSKLATVYAKALARDKQTHNFVQKSERAWIRKLVGVCGDALNCIKNEYDWKAQFVLKCGDNLNCIRNEYTSRLAFLDAISTSEQNGSTFDLKDISTQYDFSVHMYGQEGTLAAGEGPGRVTVRAKDKLTTPQVIIIESIRMMTDTNGRPITNSVQDGYEGMINVGDFNFDGRDDFAVLNGMNGSYGSASYDVYLNKGSKFEFSVDFSILFSGLTFPNFDSKSKTIKTESKSGCCWHESAIYTVVNDKPEKIERLVDETSASEGGDSTYSYTERFINGRWKQVSARGIRPDNYCEDDLLQTNQKVGHPERRLASCGLIPEEHAVGVIAAAYTFKSRSYGLDIFIVDLNDGKLLAKLTNDNEFSQVATGAGNPPEHMRIDTGRFNLKEQQRAFGVRSSFRAQTQNRDTYFTLLSLYLRKGDAITPVLEHMVVALSNNKEETKRTLSLQKSSTNGFADIMVHEIISGRDDGDAERRDFVVRYDGNKYVLPKSITTHP